MLYETFNVVANVGYLSEVISMLLNNTIKFIVNQFN